MISQQIFLSDSENLSSSMSAFVNHSPSISVISCEALSVIALHFFTSLSSVTRSRKARRQKYYRGSSSSVLPLNHVLCCTLLWHEFQTTEEHPQNYQNHFFEFQSIVQQTSPDCSQPSRRSSRVLGGPPECHFTWNSSCHRDRSYHPSSS